MLAQVQSGAQESNLSLAGGVYFGLRSKTGRHHWHVTVIVSRTGDGRCPAVPERVLPREEFSAQRPQL